MKAISLLLLLLLFAPAGRPELKLPAIIGDNMVLQQRQANPLWGWDTPGTEVTVTFAAQTKRATADARGRWRLKLDPVPASAQPAFIRIRGSSSREVKNVLVGEVWVCAGQSNMEWNISRSIDGDLERLRARLPRIRLVSVPHVGTQELQDDFQGRWEECSPANVGEFTAVGYLFGRILHEALDVPIGLVDISWGSSRCETWIRRDVLESDGRFSDLLGAWKKTEAVYAAGEEPARYEKALGEWKKTVEAARVAGKPAPPPLLPPKDSPWGSHRPGNIFAGVVHPILGYGIHGVVWYQGESNVGRAAEYAQLFPLLIRDWRKEWGQDDFPFYWVQLTDFKDESRAPGDSELAALREAQTMTLSSVPNTGQAVIIDLGESNDVHPGNKRDVAVRLARWALARDYGVPLRYRSPEYRAFEVQAEKIVVSFNCFGSSLRTRDLDEVRGFAICGEDRRWVWGKAKIVGADRVEISSPEITRPVAVRYAWADNPVCNVYSRDGLPLTPFRTDNFPSANRAKN